MPFFPLLFVLAGLTLFLSRRRYKAIEGAGSPRSPHVVVKGHTYSDSVEGIELRPLPSTKIENVRSACIIGAGHVGALTAVILASQNPHVQFCVVDRDPSLIDAWNSDRPPVFEPGLEELLFDDPPGFAMDATSCPAQPETVDSLDRSRRPRKLTNLTFSTNIQAGVVAADLVFLCVECAANASSESKDDIDLEPLEAAIQAIAQVSTGHKIIVQRSTAPCGIVQRIKKALRKTASPTASFDVLSNPDFLIPGTAVQDLLYPPRVLIGHIFSEDMSVEAITALKRLYLPWIPEERLITMDAWSSELGKLAANACLAQQISNVQSLSAICESTNANIAHITQTLGFPPRVGLGFGGSNSHAEIFSLIYLARELGLQPVADYWRAVLQMNEFYTGRTAKRVTERFPGAMKDHRVAILGYAATARSAQDRSSTALGLVHYLRSIGVQVTIYDPRIPGDQLQSTLRLTAPAALEASIAVAESFDAACQGCSGLILYSDYDEFSHEQVRWQSVAGRMQGPKVFLDLCGRLERFKMQQWGFDVLQLGVRQKDAQ